jgi:DNA-binding FrmR family transcriptional regulator
MSAEQLSAVNTAVAAVLAVLVRHAVRPTVKPADDTQPADDVHPAPATR